MIRCVDTLNKVFFGDFGGNLDLSDCAERAQKPDLERLTRTLESEEFERTLCELLPAVVGDWTVREFTLADGRRLLTVPALGRRYALAGQLALAKCLGYTMAAYGSDERCLVDAAVAGAERAGLKLSLTLGRGLSADKAYCEALRARGIELDADTCVRLFDTPYAYLELLSLDPAKYVLRTEANYGFWPKPQLTGLLAGLFGEELCARLGRVPEAVCVPIENGTEALALYHAMEGAAFATAEELIAAEYHTMDAGTYTLSTRSAAREEENTTICPELADLWRQGKVIRLGADRLLPVDESALPEALHGATARRAAALALEQLNRKELLLVEVE